MGTLHANNHIGTISRLYERYEISFDMLITESQQRGNNVLRISNADNLWFPGLWLDGTTFFFEDNGFDAEEDAAQGKHYGYQTWVNYLPLSKWFNVKIKSTFQS